MLDVPLKKVLNFYKNRGTVFQQVKLDNDVDQHLFLYEKNMHAHTLRSITQTASAPTLSHWRLATWALNVNRTHRHQR
ncbi:hypothetical protein VAZ01S_058_00240 [Vibrio azureus NBRC 104587]|uniref:Uncharacterized protein n=1 Tax=Vibrio azureus NBRC 104587 TaxID=1219077 RepID=U3C6L2_9VIBR|nr:hypothetical protein VAZ01S_058_00240 [Vibrio azureus NBRC 104587]